MFDLAPFFRGRDDFSLWNFQNTAFRTDIRDEGDHFLLEAELPGFKKEDISVSVDDRYLTISAQRTKEEKSEESYLCHERTFGSFRRSFTLQAIDSDNITGSYTDGILKVVLPKAKASEERKKLIEIT